MNANICYDVQDILLLIDVWCVFGGGGWGWGGGGGGGDRTRYVRMWYVNIP